MLSIYIITLCLLSTQSLVSADVTNLKEFLNVFKQNPSKTFPIGFLSQGNVDIVKRYLLSNTNIIIYPHLDDLLKAIDNETIVAGVSTGLIAEDIGPKYHIFSSLLISPQAMLVAPDYHPITAPYGVQNTSTQDLYDALNAAIADVQREDIDETIFTKYGRTDIARSYSCRQSKQLPVVNRANATGYLNDILTNTTKFYIGGLGPYDWGTHDGNYQQPSPTGIYPDLLNAVMKKLGQLKGPDGVSYGQNISYEIKYYKTVPELFRALLEKKIHATDVYLLIDAPYTGTNENCTNDAMCRARETCVNGNCVHPDRPRSLHFRATCTTASRDTKFITKIDSKLFRGNNTTMNNVTTAKTPSSTTSPPPKSRWAGFLLLFTVLFGTIFLILLVLVRRKKNYRIQQTLPGGFGKFARLQEEAEPPMDSIDPFDDHDVQLPRETTSSMN